MKVILNTLLHVTVLHRPFLLSRTYCSIEESELRDSHHLLCRSKTSGLIHVFRNLSFHDFLSRGAKIPTFLQGIVHFSLDSILLPAAAAMITFAFAILTLQAAMAPGFVHAATLALRASSATTCPTSPTCPNDDECIYTANGVSLQVSCATDYYGG